MEIKFNGFFVRDKVPDKIKENGYEVSYQVEKDPIRRSELLFDKLEEELKEFHREVKFNLDTKNIHLEIVDVIEVMFSIGELYGYSIKDTEKEVKNMRKKFGGFKDYISIENVRVKENE